MKFVTKIIITLTLSLISFSLFAQEKKQEVKFFIVENKNQLSKDSLIKIGKLSINNEKFEIAKFTYIIDGFCSNGNGAAKYGFVTGNNFSEKMIEDIKLSSSSGRNNIIIQDVYVYKKTGNNMTMLKLDYLLKINIKN